MGLASREKVQLIEFNNPDITITKQAKLLDISRSTIYYQPVINPVKKILMDKIDEIYTQCPFYGKRRIQKELKLRGFDTGIKQVSSLMKVMGIEAIYPKPKTTISDKQHVKYPYLLRNKIIKKINEVWSTDITYIKMKNGWIYLVAIIDWFSRYILSWEVSITLENHFCISALENALKISKPDIFNSDQGVQFTSNNFINILEENSIKISMDGVGRCLDNIFIERFWRTIKYEEVYLKDYDSVSDAVGNLKEYFYFYNHKRLHSAIDYQPPAKIYCNA